MAEQSGGVIGVAAGNGRERNGRERMASMAPMESGEGGGVASHPIHVLSHSRIAQALRERARGRGVCVERQLPCRAVPARLSLCDPPGVQQCVHRRRVRRHVHRRHLPPHLPRGRARPLRMLCGGRGRARGGKARRRPVRGGGGEFGMKRIRVRRCVGVLLGFYKGSIRVRGAHLQAERRCVPRDHRRRGRVRVRRLQRCERRGQRARSRVFDRSVQLRPKSHDLPPCRCDARALQCLDLRLPTARRDRARSATTPKTRALI